MNKTSLIVVLVLVILLALLVIFVHPKAPPASVQTQSDSGQVSGEFRVVNQDYQTVLADFPAGFPLETGVQNTASYRYIPANSQELQSTLEYTSQKSLADNSQIFSSYLTAAGFKLETKTNQANMVFYYATKDNNDLSILLQLQAGQIQVNASYLKR